MVTIENTSRSEDLPDWLTVHELRAYLRLGRTATYELIRAGKIPHRRFGRMIRVPRHAVIEIQGGQANR